MNDDAPHLKVIPSDYSCSLVFREFKKTKVSERRSSLRRDRMFFRGENGGIDSRHYCGPNACLQRYLTLGWPEAHQGAKWNHRERRVEIFADDLFLCPKCGVFNLTDLGSDPFGSLGLDIRGEVIEFWPSKILVTDECAEKIRSFCESRLETKEFYFKECVNIKCCEEIRQIELARLRTQRSRRAETQLFSEPIAETKTIRSAEKLPWDEGYVYLVRCGEYHKIGLAKDTDKRISGLQTSSPFEIEMIKSWRCKRPDEMERILHKRYAEHRLRGEWFKLPEDILKSLLVVEDLRKEFVPEE